MGFWEKKYFIEDTILLEMGPLFYKVIRITRGSGGLPADSCPVLSIWIARRGRTELEKCDKGARGGDGKEKSEKERIDWGHVRVAGQRQLFHF